MLRQSGGDESSQYIAVAIGENSEANDAVRTIIFFWVTVKTLYCPLDAPVDSIGVSDGGSPAGSLAGRSTICAAAPEEVSLPWPSCELKTSLLTIVTISVS